VPSGIDHLIIACADPSSAAAELGTLLGLPVAEGGRHAAHGTFNRLIWLGDSYVELMGVFDAELAAASWWGRHVVSVLSRAPAGGLAGVPLATLDLRDEVSRLRGQGSTIADPVPGERVRPDGQVVRWSIARLPAPDPELGLLFLIQHDTNAAEWRPSDRAERAAETSAWLARVEVPAADLARASVRLAREVALRFRPSLAGGGARDASLGDQTLRLVPFRGTEPPAPRIVVRGGSFAGEVDLLGCRWQVMPTGSG
jgi:Glyoxalase-like domain